MITYSKLFKILSNKGYTSRYWLQQNGIHPATISKLQKNERINTDTINKICFLLNCQPGDILEYIPDETDSQFDTNIQYLYLDFPDISVSAGTGQLLDNNESDIKLKIISTQLTRAADFVLKIDGDSMEPNFFDGDIVLVKKTSAVDIGDVGIFAFNGNGYIKQFGGDCLISYNKNYPDIKLTENDSFYCFGKVIGKIQPSS